MELYLCYKNIIICPSIHKIIIKLINILGFSSISPDLFHLARNRYNLYYILDTAYIHKYNMGITLTETEFNIVYCIIEKYNMCLISYLDIILEMLNMMHNCPESAVIFDDFYTNCLRIIT